MASGRRFEGGEDIDFGTIGGAISTSGNPNILVDTTANHFRSGYARHALNISSSGAAPGAAGVNVYFLTSPSLSGGTGGLTTFWWTARFFCSQAGSVTENNQWWWLFKDANGVTRLRIRNTGNSPSGPYIVEKLTAAGAATQLGSSLSGGPTNVPTSPDKLDMYLDYGVSGTLKIYINQTQVFTFSGDTTTDGNTTLDAFWLGSATGNAQTGSVNAWSEAIVNDNDTRAMSLVSQAATANGNTHAWTSGAASNVNGNLASYTGPDNSGTAAQIQEYTVTPAMPAGSFSVLYMCQHGMCVTGPSGPTQIQFMTRTGGADYNGSSQAPSGHWSLMIEEWDLNPATSAAWQTTDFPNASSGYNLGYESIA